MKRAEIERRREFIRAESRRRCALNPATLDHYSVRVRVIEEGILPLVRAFDSALTTPIFSCEGHWRDRAGSSDDDGSTRTTPYVTFLVLPGKAREFRSFLNDLLHHTPRNRLGFELWHRHHPKHAGNGPFVDWRVTLHVPSPGMVSEEEFEKFKRTSIAKYARFFRDRFRRFATRRSERPGGSD